MAADFDALPHEERLRCLRKLAAAALSSYDMSEPAEPALINRSENATYRIDDPASGRRWALRVHRESYHTQNAIASELAWLMALRRDGVVTTPVRRGRDRDLRHAPPHVPGRRDRLAFGDRPRGLLYAWIEGCQCPCPDRRAARLAEESEAAEATAASKGRMH